MKTIYTAISINVVEINLVPRSLVDETALEIWIRDCVGMPTEETARQYGKFH